MPVFEKDHRSIFKRLAPRQVRETAIPNRPNSKNPSRYQKPDTSTPHQSSNECSHREDGRLVSLKHGSGRTKDRLY